MKLQLCEFHKVRWAASFWWFVRNFTAATRTNPSATKSLVRRNIDSVLFLMTWTLKDVDLMLLSLLRLHCCTERAFLPLQRRFNSWSARRGRTRPQLSPRIHRDFFKTWFFSSFILKEIPVHRSSVLNVNTHHEYSKPTGGDIIERKLLPEVYLILAQNLQCWLYRRDLCSSFNTSVPHYSEWVT